MIILAVIISYLIGSIPTAYIYGKLTKGIDIRRHGSGNIGATNVFRVLGKVPGSIVLILDIVKGVLAVWGVYNIFHLGSYMDLIFLSVSVVSGHNWTIFLKFKGGKGVATSLGVLIALTILIPGVRIVLLITIMAWILCFLITGFVSLASIVAITILPITMVLTGQPNQITTLGVIFCLFVVYRHRPNIKRLLSGEEPKVPILPHLKKK